MRQNLCRGCLTLLSGLVFALLSGCPDTVPPQGSDQEPPPVVKATTDAAGNAEVGYAGDAIAVTVQAAESNYPIVGVDISLDPESGVGLAFDPQIRFLPEWFEVATGTAKDRLRMSAFSLLVRMTEAALNSATPDPQVVRTARLSGSSIQDLPTSLPAFYSYGYAGAVCLAELDSLRKLLEGEIVGKVADTLLVEAITELGEASVSFALLLVSTSLTLDEFKVASYWRNLGYSDDDWFDVYYRCSIPTWGVPCHVVIWPRDSAPPGDSCNNPAAPDSDGDGVPDNTNNCRYTYNATQSDRDGDDVGDPCDNCPDDPNKTSPGDCGCGEVEVPNCGRTQPPNQPPVAYDQTVSVTYNRSRAITLSGFDEDAGPQALQFSIDTNPIHGTLTGTPPTVTYAPTPGYTGPDSFAFTVSDGEDSSDAATVMITVSGLGTPIANAGDDQTITTESDCKLVILNGARSSDLNGQIVSYIWQESGTQVATGQTATTTLCTGLHTITLTVTDNDGLTATDDVSIRVVPGGACATGNHLSTASQNWDDSINVNNAINGKMEDGEHVRVQPNLCTSATVTTIYGTLNSSDPGISISKKNVYYDDFNSGSCPASVGWFEMNLNFGLVEGDSKQACFTMYVTYKINGAPFCQDVQFCGTFYGPPSPTAHVVEVDDICVYYRPVVPPRDLPNGCDHTVASGEYPCIDIFLLNKSNQGISERSCSVTLSDVKLPGGSPLSGINPLGAPRDYPELPYGSVARGAYGQSGWWCVDGGGIPGGVHGTVMGDVTVNCSSPADSFTLDDYVLFSIE